MPPLLRAQVSHTVCADYDKTNAIYQTRDENTMRIITDGKRFAVARGRWFWTEFQDRTDEVWWCTARGRDLFCWFATKEEAQKRLEESQTKPLKYWDVE